MSQDDEKLIVTDHDDLVSKPSENPTEEEEYSFVKEVTKKKPLVCGKLIKKIVWIVIAAAAAGIIASFVFVKFTPLMNRLFGEKKEAAESEKVNIVIEEDEPTPTPTPTSTPVPTQEPRPDEPGPTLVTEIVMKELELTDYTQLHAKMTDVADEAARAMVTIIGISSQMDYFNQTYENESQISGLIVADNGSELYVLTEYRIVDGVERVLVTFCDGTMADALFQKQDTATGLAVLKVSKQGMSMDTRQAIKVASLGSSYGIAQGQPVIAAGSPSGYSGSMSFGMVTSTTNEICVTDGIYNLLTTDISGTKGGSGILVDFNGRIVGVIAQQYSNENSMVTALGVSQLHQLIEDLSNNVPLPYVGLRGQDVTPAIAEKTGIPIGVIVTSMDADSPAALAGIKEADVIVEVGAFKVTNLADYQTAIYSNKPGQQVKIKALRMGAEGYTEIQFELTIGSR